MASFTLKGGQTFPEGTSVAAHPRSQWPSWQAPSGAPSGAASASGTVTNNTVTFTGLTEGTEYVAYAASPNRLRNFMVPRSAPGTAAQVTAGGNLGTAYTFDAASASQAWLTGTLNGNVTVTLQGLAAGTTVQLFLTQDATGGRTVTVSDGGSSVSVPVSPLPSALTVVDVFSPDGSTANVSVR